MMLPVIDALTTSTWCARNATIAMMSSAAFPNVAFRNPPSVGPERFASSSVASPIKPAAGMSEIAAALKTQSEVLPVAARNQLTGAATSRTLSQLPVTAFQSCDGIDTPEIMSDRRAAYLSGASVASFCDAASNSVRS